MYEYIEHNKKDKARNFWITWAALNLPLSKAPQRARLCQKKTSISCYVLSQNTYITYVKFIKTDGIVQKAAYFNEHLVLQVIIYVFFILIHSTTVKHMAS